MGFFSRLYELLIMPPSDIADEIKHQKNIIKESAYKGRDDIIEYDIPNGTVEIGEYAFRDCVNLERVSFPNTLRRIRNNAFMGCKSLKEVILPDSVVRVDNGAFADCDSLTTAVLSKGMNNSEISGGLFYRCPSLEKVVMPDRIKKSFANVFPHCESLRSFEIPYGCEEIGAFTFEYCSGLESVKIPDTVKVIEYKAFLCCTALTEIYIPDSVKQIGSYKTFYNCSNLRRIRLPEDFSFKKFSLDEGTGIVRSCFEDCSSLRVVTIGDTDIEVDGEFTDETLLLAYAELAAAGKKQFRNKVAGYFREVMAELSDKNKAETAEKILELFSPEDIPAESLLAAIDYAANTGSHEVYLMLTKFRNGGEGESIEPSDIFRL